MRHPECGHGNHEADYECCMCCMNPCTAVDVPLFAKHTFWVREQDRRATEQAIDYAITYRKRQGVPW